MTEAITRIIEYAKNEMKTKKIYAYISVDNLASIKTVEKQGFIRTDNHYFEEFRGNKYPHDIYLLDL